MTNKLDICHLQIYNSTQTDLQGGRYKHLNNVLMGTPFMGNDNANVSVVFFFF